MRFFTLLLCFALSLCLRAQYKNVDLSLSCQTPLVANQTMDLQFTLFLANYDGEYGDSLALEFDPGVQPNSTPNNPFGPSSQGQSPETFNGVFGQLISWGDNNNSTERGGIENRQFYTFIVNVSVDDTVTSPKKVRFFLSCDGVADYPSSPKDDNGFIMLTLEAAKPDLSLNTNCPIQNYYRFPKRMLPDTIPLSAEVRNLGGVQQNQSVIVFDGSSGAYFSSEQLPRPFEGNSSITIKPTVPLIPKTGKTYSLSTYLISPDDADNSNHTFDACEFAVSDTILARTPRLLEDSVSLIDAGMIGSVYQLPKADTLLSISVYLLNPTDGDSIQFMVHSFNGNPGSLIMRSQTLVFGPNDQAGWYTLSMPDTLALTNAPVFIGLQFYSANSTYIGTNSTNYQPGRNYILPEGLSLFEPAESFGSEHQSNYMFELNLGKPSFSTGSPLSLSKHSFKSANLSPNPCQNFLKTPQSWNGEYFKIFSADGRELINGRIQNGEINTSNFSPGLYFIQMANEQLPFLKAN